jgi:hypothetical protein
MNHTSKSPLRAVLVAALLLMSGGASAQQPGSAAYNSVFLPAHGVGDTRQQNLMWGALAYSRADAWSAFVVDGGSEEEARSMALTGCAEKGGENCEVLFTFANTCAAVAASDVEHAYSHGYSLGSVRRRALRACEKECEILYEGCTPGAR